MSQTVNRGRRDDDWVRPGATEHGRRRIAVRHVHQHARADIDLPPRLDVAGESQLIPGAARVVAVRAGIQDAGCALLEVGDRAWQVVD